MVAILVVIYIVFISLGLPDSLFGASWPVVHLDFGVGENMASLYSIVTGLCSGGASFLAGKVLRRFGTPNVTFASIFLTVIGLFGISFSPNLWVMMFFAVVMGYGAGAIDTGLNNYVSLHYKAHHMNWLHCFWGIGVTASPLIMAFFLGKDVPSWRGGYRAVAIIQLCIAVIVAFALKKWKKLDSSFEVSTEETNEKKASFRQIMKIPGVISGILSLGFYCSMEFTIGTWGATYLVNTAALTPDTAAKWISAYFGGIMLGRLVAGFASMKLSDNALICCGLMISVFGFVFLALPFEKLSTFALLLIGFGFGPVFPNVLHSVPSRFGKDFSADITGFHMGGAYAVGFAVQLIFGYVACATTFKIMPYVLLCLAVLSFTANFITVKKAENNAVQ